MSGQAAGRGDANQNRYSPGFLGDANPTSWFINKFRHAGDSRPYVAQARHGQTFGHDNFIASQNFEIITHGGAPERALNVCMSAGGLVRPVLRERLGRVSRNDFPAAADPTSPGRGLSDRPRSQFQVDVEPRSLPFACAETTPRFERGAFRRSSPAPRAARPCGLFRYQPLWPYQNDAEMACLRCRLAWPLWTRHSSHHDPFPGYRFVGRSPPVGSPTVYMDRAPDDLGASARASAPLIAKAVRAVSTKTDGRSN